jgi:hypothetical protein
MKTAALDRIVQRLVRARLGQAASAGELAWDVSFPEDPEDENPAEVAFKIRVPVEDGLPTAIESDGPGADVEQVPMRAAFLTDFAAALAQERVTFDSFEALAGYLIEAFDCEIEDSGAVRIDPVDEDDTPLRSLFVSPVLLAGEPWVNLDSPFPDDFSAESLLRMNGKLTHLHFEAFEGGVRLAGAFPLVLMTGRRITELVDDLLRFRVMVSDALVSEGERERGKGGRKRAKS